VQIAEVLARDYLTSGKKAAKAPQGAL